jgi:hypothetical protein
MIFAGKLRQIDDTEATSNAGTGTYHAEESSRP